MSKLHKHHRRKRKNHHHHHHHHQGGGESKKNSADGDYFYFDDDDETGFLQSIEDDKSAEAERLKKELEIRLKHRRKAALNVKSHFFDLTLFNAPRLACWSISWSLVMSALGFASMFVRAFEHGKAHEELVDCQLALVVGSLLLPVSALVHCAAARYWLRPARLFPSWARVASFLVLTTVTLVYIGLACVYLTTTGSGGDAAACPRRSMFPYVVSWMLVGAAALLVLIYGVAACTFFVCLPWLSAQSVAAVVTLQVQSSAPPPTSGVRYLAHFVWQPLGRQLPPVAFGPAPGRCKSGVRRSVQDDLDSLAAQGVTSLVCLLGDQELACIEATSLPDQCAERGILFNQVHVRDKWIPVSMADYCRAVLHAVRLLDQGECLLVHCNGGVGRSATFVCCLLVVMGDPVDQALASVRNARPHALRNPLQLLFVNQFARDWTYFVDWSGPEQRLSQPQSATSARTSDIIFVPITGGDTNDVKETPPPPLPPPPATLDGTELVELRKKEDKIPRVCLVCGLDRVSARLTRGSVVTYCCRSCAIIKEKQYDLYGTVRLK